MKLLFSIDRSDDMSLVNQMFQGLKKAIVHGVYKPGQMLPGIHGGHEYMCTYLKKSGGKLPDVFLFTDDHLAHGGLLALMERGIKVPEDVKVVTHANRGLGPFWVKPLTRLEMDPVAQGAVVAKAVLDYFRTRALPSDIVLGSDWKVGETF